MSDRDARFMALALALGERGLGRVWPRPSVGCVIAQGDRIVGRGATDGQHGSHGEVIALAQAGGAAKGATAYVTLEPCSHHGRQPPCCDALIAAGVSRVVSAMEDPFPQVAGRGHARLRAAGLQVDVGLFEERARATHAGFLSTVEQGRPLVTLKLATSFDGRIATASGESQWITGPEARAWVHLQRARHDAVVVGGGTARTDDPSLTVRGLGIAHQPLRVVVSRHLDLPVPSKLFSSARDVPVWLVHGPNVPEDRRQDWTEAGAVMHEAALGPDGQMDPASVLSALGAAGLTRVYCEGGGGFAASLLEAGLIDRLFGFTAGLVLGAEGWPAIGAMGVSDLGAAQRFHLVECRQVGADVLHEWVTKF